jgi:hypothetical protein
MAWNHKSRYWRRLWFWDVCAWNGSMNKAHLLLPWTQFDACCQSSSAIWHGWAKQLKILHLWLGGFCCQEKSESWWIHVCCSVQGRRRLCKKLSQWQRNKMSWYHISINNSKKLKKQNQNHIHCEQTAVKSSEHQASSRSQRSSKEATTKNKHYL